VRAARRAALLALTGFAAAGLAWAAPSADEDAQALNGDADYAAGREALKAGRTEVALASFQRALRRYPEAADLHNELGYSHRKLRQMDKAFEHYKKALTLDPRHRGAHEYIGEAYLMVGNLPAAEEHLAALRSICLLSCEELEDLRRAIAEFKARPR
jgi:tetratricopeptide (TPR) repeat protein